MVMDYCAREGGVQQTELRIFMTPSTARCDTVHSVSDCHTPISPHRTCTTRSLRSPAQFGEVIFFGAEGGGHIADQAFTSSNTRRRRNTIVDLVDQVPAPLDRAVLAMRAVVYPKPGKQVARLFGRNTTIEGVSAVADGIMSAVEGMRYRASSVHCLSAWLVMFGGFW